LFSKNIVAEIKYMCALNSIIFLIEIKRRQQLKRTSFIVDCENNIVSNEEN
jgi:hypothetical protein